MKNLLIKASISYADEFNCKIFGLYTEEQWNTFCEKVKIAFSILSKESEIELYFGTNECLTFDSYEQWFKKFSVTEISETETIFLKEKFGQVWGTGNCALSSILDALNDKIE